MPQVTKVIDLRRRRRVRLAGIGIAAALIAVIAGSIVVWNMSISSKQADQAHASATSQALAYDRAGQYVKERAVLETYMKTNPPKKYRYPADISLGDLTYNAGDDKAALRWYKDAQATGGKPQLLDVLGLAQATEATGDKTGAIRYLKQAITLTEAEKVDQASIPSLVLSYQQQISYLESTP